MKPVTDEQLEEFRQRVVDLHRRNKVDYTVTVERLKKYARYWHKSHFDRSHPGRGSSWGFVDLANGDILKCDGWKRPAKHARGNINNPDMDIAKMLWTGPPYLK